MAKEKVDNQGIGLLGQVTWDRMGDAPTLKRRLGPRVGFEFFEFNLGGREEAFADF